MKSFFKKYWAVFIPIAILIIAVLFIFIGGKANENEIIGMVDARFVDVSTMYPGRLDSLFVEKGDTVRKGQLLAVLQTTEINAVKQQALSAITAARNNLELLKQGPRKESVQSSKELLKIAQHQYNLMKKTYQRIHNLYQDSVISGEEKDLTYYKLQAAEKEKKIAKLHAQMLQKGTQPEMIQAAEAVLEQAEQSYQLVKSISKNTHVQAPATGIISTLITDVGETISIGYPMMTIQKLGSYYVRFNIRQDKMNHIRKGMDVGLNIPGIDQTTIKAKVTQIAPALKFANWVPEAQTGKFELRTFEVHVKPTESVKNLRPGMTAELILPK
jgi:HlyD family secretion protein